MNNQLIDTVLEIIQRYTSDPNQELTLDTQLSDVGIESISILEILFDLEEAFGITVPNVGEEQNQLSSFQTPKDVVALVESLAQKTSE